VGVNQRIPLGHCDVAGEGEDLQQRARARRDPRRSLPGFSLATMTLPDSPDLTSYLLVMGLSEKPCPGALKS